MKSLKTESDVMTKQAANKARSTASRTNPTKDEVSTTKWVTPPQNNAEESPQPGRAAKPKKADPMAPVTKKDSDEKPTKAKSLQVTTCSVARLQSIEEPSESPPKEEAPSDLPQQTSAFIPKVPKVGTKNQNSDGLERQSRDTSTDIEQQQHTRNEEAPADTPTPVRDPIEDVSDGSPPAPSIRTAPRLRTVPVVPMRVHVIVNPTFAFLGWRKLVCDILLTASDLPTISAALLLYRELPAMYQGIDPMVLKLVMDGSASARFLLTRALTSRFNSHKLLGGLGYPEDKTHLLVNHIHRTLAPNLGATDLTLKTLIDAGFPIISSQEMLPHLLRISNEIREKKASLSAMATQLYGTPVATTAVAAARAVGPFPAIAPTTAVRPILF